MVKISSMDRRSLSSAQCPVNFCPLSIRLSPAMIDRKGTRKLTRLSRISRIPLTQPDNMIGSFVKLARHCHKQDVAGLGICYSQSRIDCNQPTNILLMGLGRACSWLGNSSTQQQRVIMPASH
jgi:hypothetical protein